MTLKKYFRPTIGGDGFTGNVENEGENIIARGVAPKLLKDPHHRLERVVIELNKLVATMPPELFNVIGDDVMRQGEELNNLLGSIGFALDQYYSN